MDYTLTNANTAIWNHTMQKSQKNITIVSQIIVHSHPTLRSSSIRDESGAVDHSGRTRGVACHGCNQAVKMWSKRRQWRMIKEGCRVQRRPRDARLLYARGHTHGAKWKEESISFSPLFSYTDLHARQCARRPPALWWVPTVGTVMPQLQEREEEM